MEVGPFRTIPASQTESGEVEVKLINGGWEEFATIIFGESVYKLILRWLAD
jgi:carboxypeptidase D